MARLCVITLSLALITCPSQVSCPPGGPVEVVEAEVGGDAILPCNHDIPLNSENLQVKWKHNGLVVHVYRSGGDDYSAQHKNFTNRTSFSCEPDKGKTFLQLINVTEWDNGTYICAIINNNSSDLRKYNVTLEPVKNSDTKIQTDTKADSENTGNGNNSKIVTPVIVIGVIAAAAVIAIVLSVIRIKRRNRQQQHEQIEMDDAGDGGRDLGAGPDGRGQHVQVEMDDAEDEG